MKPYLDISVDLAVSRLTWLVKGLVKAQEIPTRDMQRSIIGSVEAIRLYALAGEPRLALDETKGLRAAIGGLESTHATRAVVRHCLATEKTLERRAP